MISAWTQIYAKCSRNTEEGDTKPGGFRGILAEFEGGELERGDQGREFSAERRPRKSTEKRRTGGSYRCRQITTNLVALNDTSLPSYASKVEV